MRFGQPAARISGFDFTCPNDATGRTQKWKREPAANILPHKAGESHLANKRLFCCGKSILGVLR
ncbi:hypothetical protein CN092_32005 [Sinorhizobium meliloti]|nr:hypothetical protein CN092_32005 [Sinorhizobium meliloti]